MDDSCVDVRNNEKVREVSVDSGYCMVHGEGVDVSWVFGVNGGREATMMKG